VIPGYQSIARPGRWPGRHRLWTAEVLCGPLFSVSPCLRVEARSVPSVPSVPSVLKSA